MQPAVPCQALKIRRIAALQPGTHASQPALNALGPVFAALKLLMDADSVKISHHVPGRRQTAYAFKHLCQEDFQE